MIHHHTIEVVQVVSAFIGALLNFWAGWDSVKDYYYQKKWRQATEDTMRVTTMALRRDGFTIFVQLLLFYFGMSTILAEPENFVLPDRAYASRYTMTTISAALVIASAWDRWDRQILFKRARKKTRRFNDTHS